MYQLLFSLQTKIVYTRESDNKHKKGYSLKKYLKILLTSIVIMNIIACNKDADIASKNLSTKADNFQIDRRIIFYNSITDTYMLSILGKCSVKKDNKDKQLEVTCKTSKDTYKKHYLGISDNVTYFVEQLTDKKVNTYHYEVIFKPQSIIPDINFKGNLEKLKEIL